MNVPRPRELRRILREIRNAGLTVESVKLGKHVKIRIASGNQTRLFVTAATPSDWRAARNNHAKLRRMRRELHAGGNEGGDLLK